MKRPSLVTKVHPDCYFRKLTSLLSSATLSMLECSTSLAAHRGRPVVFGGLHVYSYLRPSRRRWNFLQLPRTETPQIPSLSPRFSPSPPAFLPHTMPQIAAKCAEAAV